VLRRKDLDAGFGAVWQPGALTVKYAAVVTAWGWQYVFPSTVRLADPRSGAAVPPLLEPSVQKAAWARKR
jgi:hypothetical protein